jgi:uncharacterized protein (DUF983 family)
MNSLGNPDRSKDKMHFDIEAFLTTFMPGHKGICPECGGGLVYHGFKSGIHPGIYCINGHTIVLIEMEPSTDQGRTDKA